MSRDSEPDKYLDKDTHVKNTFMSTRFADKKVSSVGSILPF
ncbi:hypothetical protein [Paenibacillus taichungensis]|nr:hypothetical protein [Paenibacillus taichungensis]